MSPNEARLWLRDLAGVDDQVRRQADRLVCRECYDQIDLEISSDGAITVRWTLDDVITTARISKEPQGGAK